MSKFLTNSLLTSCRFGIASKNQVATDAAKSLSSYIVFASLLDVDTVLPEELESRLKILLDVELHPEKYPQDIVEEVEEQEYEQSPPDGPPEVA